MARAQTRYLAVFLLQAVPLMTPGPHALVLVAETRWSLLP